VTQLSPENVEKILPHGSRNGNAPHTIAPSGNFPQRRQQSARGYSWRCTIPWIP